MYSIMTIIILVFFVTFIMISISIILSKKTKNDTEKLSPFECGFDSKSLARLPFSMHFFMITIIFLIFDVEICLIMPMIILTNIVNLTNWILISTFFILILILGLYYEWNLNMLNWTN
uniref:NADH-ubiquinone oxidoreductase chain 3 n=1 Tax=Micrasema sp. XG-2021 TaxID=2996737 RepID=A0A9E8LNJ6_9NEOP|nr:NADH dehydrogenase subunit 3 [Micrasema sp. XG-2021]